MGGGGRTPKIAMGETLRVCNPFSLRLNTTTTTPNWKWLRGGVFPLFRLKKKRRTRRKQNPPIKDASSSLLLSIPAGNWWEEEEERVSGRGKKNLFFSFQILTNSIRAVHCSTQQKCQQERKVKAKFRCFLPPLQFSFHFSPALKSAQILFLAPPEKTNWTQKVIIVAAPFLPPSLSLSLSLSQLCNYCNERACRNGFFFFQIFFSLSRPTRTYSTYKF